MNKDNNIQIETFISEMLPEKKKFRFQNSTKKMMQKCKKDIFQDIMKSKSLSNSETVKSSNYHYDGMVFENLYILKKNAYQTIAKLFSNTIVTSLQ